MAEPHVRIVPGGPMLVSGLSLARLRRGGDRWELDDAGVGADYAICRCGRSGAMPLCDRPAPYRCFQEEPASGPDPGPFRWDVPDPDGPPALALKPDGPVRVAGGVAITHGDRALERADRVSLCRCGASRCQPLCDSSHKVVGFRG